MSLFAVATFMAATATSNPSEAATPPAQQETQSEVVPDEAYKPAVMRYFEGVARDPTSIIYEWGPPPRQGWTDIAFAPRREGLVGCVGINARNGYGGYAGRRWYTYVVADGVLIQQFEGTVRIGRFISHNPGCGYR